MKRITRLVFTFFCVALIFLSTFASAQNSQHSLEVRQNIETMVSEGKSELAQKVLVLNFDPVFPMARNKRMHDLMSAWNDPKTLSKQYIKAMKESSHGNALYEIAEWIDLDELPQADNGRKYSIEEYYTTLKKAQKQWDYWGYAGWQTFGTFDYNYYMSRFNVYQRIESGEIDEVWVFTGPCAGTMAYETIMIGRSAYWCNGPQMVREDCPAFVCYVFNYERDVGCMLEDAGHRFESIMAYEFGWNTNRPISQMNDWELFTLYDKISPGNAACGNVHFAPNSDSDYDWGNRNKVYSTWKDWANNYPNLTGEKKLVTMLSWGNGDMAAHHEWWFSCIPHIIGINDTSDAYNNWWIYFNYPVRNTTDMAMPGENASEQSLPATVTSALPDLLPDPITFDNNYDSFIIEDDSYLFQTGYEVYFDTGITNSTEFDAHNNFNIKWFVNGEQLGYGMHEPIPANTDARDGNSQFSWTPVLPGIYTVTFIVDCDNQIFEANETNNEGTITISVTD